MEEDQQKWRVVWKGGLKYRDKPSTEEGVKLGTLKYDTIIRGNEKNGWVKHGKGWSMISRNDTRFLQPRIHHVVFSGLSSSHPQFDRIGAYAKQSKLIHGKHLFKQRDVTSPAFLWWSSEEKKWCIGDEEDIGGAVGSISTMKKNELDNPERCTSWGTWLDDKWVATPELQCRRDKKRKSVVITTRTTTTTLTSGANMGSNKDFGESKSMSVPLATLGPGMEKIEVTSKNVIDAIQNVRALYDNDFLWTAFAQLEDVNQVLSNNNKISSKTKKKVGEIKSELEDIIKVINDKVTAAKNVLSIMEDEASWIFAQDLFGIKTFWRFGEDGLLNLKTVGIIENCDPIYSIAVTKEGDLYKNWVPFCNSSSMIRNISKTEQIIAFNLGGFGLARDAILWGYGVDGTREANALIFVGQSIDSYPDTIFPSQPETRMFFKTFDVLVRPIGHMKSECTLVLSVNPNLPLPQWVIDYSTKKICGALLYLIIKESKRIPQKKDKSPWYRKVHNEHEDYYIHWLKPRIDAFFEKYKAPDGSDDSASLKSYSSPKEDITCGLHPILHRVIFALIFIVVVVALYMA